MLAMCCNPSRRALSFGWIQLRLWVRCKPGHEKGDCLKVPEQSYYTATLPGRWKNETRRAAGCKCSHKYHSQSAGSRVWFPERALTFCLQSCDNEEWEILVPILSLLSPIIVKLWQNYSDCNHVQCGSLLWLNVYCPFTFRNIAHGQKRSYVKK